jgi:hypothetical protein
MTWRSMLNISALAAAGLIGLSAAAYGQNPPQGQGQGQGQGRPGQQAQPARPAPPKSMKDALVGSWRLLIDDVVNPDKTQTPQLGPNPEGSVIFTANGHYSLQIMRYNRPKLAANDRTKGTADENKAAISGIITHFGTWTVDEGSKTLTFRIEGSSFPNWDGTVQKRMITSLNPNDEVTWVNSTPSAGTLPVVLAWKWVP